MKKSVILSTNENVLFIQVQMQNKEKQLGIKIDFKLNFKDHIGKVYTKTQCQIKCFDQSARVNES